MTASPDVVNHFTLVEKKSSATHNARAVTSPYNHLRTNGNKLYMVTNIVSHLSLLPFCNHVKTNFYFFIDPFLCSRDMDFHNRLLRTKSPVRVT